MNGEICFYNKPNKLGQKVWALMLEAISADNILPLTSGCNLDCLFCSHSQNPPGVASYRFSPIPPALLDQLISYLNPGRKIVIGESTTRLCEGEPFTHPYFLGVLQKLKRHFPHTPVQLTTNGALLNQNNIAELAGLREAGGLEMVVSLNSCSPDGRKKVMRDNNPANVLNGLYFCRERGIPFHGSVVALPHLLGWKDMEDTLCFLEEAGALTTRVFLPGYTRMAGPEMRFAPSLWEELCAFLEEMQERLEHPVIPEPSPKKDLSACVEGVIRNSPAHKAGLQYGDVIVSIDGAAVATAVEAFQTMKKKAAPVLHVERPGKKKGTSSGAPAETIEFTLFKEKDAPPGAVFYHDLDPHLIKKAGGKMQTSGGGGFQLMLTSSVAHPLWVSARDKGLLPTSVIIRSTQNLFFGGSICSAGLLVLSDFTYELDRVICEEGLPGQVLLPSISFDRGGFDLLGRHYSELFDCYPKLSFSFL